jgi:phosphoribosyl-AMP cyclohydrolase
MEDLNLNENGLIPAIIQNDETNQVLMLGYMNREALCIYSNSRFRGSDTHDFYLD